MAATNSRQLRLAKRPEGLPTRDDFELTEEPQAHAGDGEALVKVLYLSLDPAMRGWMSDAPSYVPPVGIGDVMRALGAGVVVESNSPALSAGDYVVGLTGVQEHATLPAEALTKVDPDLAPLPV